VHVPKARAQGDFGLEQAAGFGAAVTLHEVLTKFNPNDQHGKTSHLSKQELDDLVEYLLSL